MTARLDAYSETQQPDMNRRMANFIRLGAVAEVDVTNAKVRVQAGDMLTDWLPWIVARAGEDRTWWAPDVGEQVVLLSPSGEMNQAVVLGSIYQDKHKPPSNDADISRTEWKDKGFIQYNRKTHEYELNVPADGTIKINIGGTKLTMKGDSATLDSGKLTINAETTVTGPFIYTAGMTGSGGLGGASATITGNMVHNGGDLSSNGIVLHTHKHGIDGSKTTEPIGGGDSGGGSGGGNDTGSGNVGVW